MNNVLKKIIAGILALLLLATGFTVIFSAEGAAFAAIGEFTGYSSGLTETELKNATNTFNINGSPNGNTVREAAPQVTVLVPGLGCTESAWSNNYAATGGNSFAYNSNSLVEKLRNQGDAVVYLAKCTSEYEEDDRPLLIEGELIDSQKFVLYKCPQLANEYDTYNLSSLQKITKIDDISKHIIILFRPSDPSGSNNQIYEQYDVKRLNGGVLPKVNLISHSRGSITIMQYALDHPHLVESLFPIGGVYNGSNLGQQEWILNLVGMSNDPNNDDFTFGVRDILDSQLYI